MDKVDLKKELKHLFNPSAKEVAIVEVPRMNFLMIDGAGDPNTSQEYKGAIEALYGVSYTLKFMVKKGKPAMDYAVMSLEGLWWVDDMTQFSPEKKYMWKWTSMIMQPGFVTPELFNKALGEVKRKKDPNDPQGDD